VTDFCDRAAALEEAQRGDALDAQQRRSGLVGKTVSDSAHKCQVCTHPIPRARREAYPGTQTCRHCQAELEAATAGGATKCK